MKESKPYFLRRIVAYLIDFIIVSLLAGIVSMTLFKDNYDNYKRETQKLAEITMSRADGKVTDEEYTIESDNINYYLTKDNIPITIVNICAFIVYYVILCYYCGGITLGKYIMKLRIVSANSKKLNLGHFLLRSLFINLILSNLLSIIMVLVLNKETFIKVYSNISTVLTVFLIVTLVFIMYREDGRGLHDLMANTKIISTKKSKEEIKEALVVEEKKENKKINIKKNTKKGSDSK